MPFKHYHGRTGQVYNVTKRAVGVRVAKQVNGRIINKHLNVRVDHVIPSKCRDDLKARVARKRSSRRRRRGARGACCNRSPTASRCSCSRGHDDLSPARAAILVPRADLRRLVDAWAAGKAPDEHGRRRAADVARDSAERLTKLFDGGCGRELASVNKSDSG